MIINSFFDRERERDGKLQKQGAKLKVKETLNMY